MADKKKSKSGWNAMSSSQKSDFKASNFDKSIKVSESTIQGLRDGKTFEGNVAKFKSGATAEQREAMNRFYGKNRVGAALGTGVSTINKTYPANSYNIPNKTTNNPGAGYKGASSTNYTPPKGKGPTMGSIGKNVGTFVQNELLGVDDFKRSVKYAKEGNVKGAIKSGLTGQAELGLTVASVVGSAFTGGATGAALWGAKAGAVAAKQAAKQGAKTGAKTAAKSTAKGTTGAAKKVVKTAVTGSPVKGTVKGVKAVAKAPKAGYKAVKGAGNVFVAVTPAAKTAAAATKTSKAATTAYKAKKAEAGGKAAKGMGASYDAMKTSGKAASQARSTLKKKVAKGKLVRKGARRGQMVHYGAATMTRDEKK